MSNASDAMTFVYSSTDSPPFKVGSILNKADGDSYRFVRATDAITVNWPVFDADTSASLANVTYDYSEATGPCRGVCVAALAAAEYGWVKRKGLQTINVTASVESAGYALKIVGDGYFDLCDDTADQTFAWSITTNTQAGTLTAEIDCP